MVQVIRCKCGSIIAGCVDPYCYQDAEWMKKIRSYVKKGATIEMMEKPSLEHCKCNYNNTGE